MPSDTINTFPGYTLGELLSKTQHSLVFRACPSGEATTVIIKVLSLQHPTPAQIARFRHEYDLIRRIDMDGIIKTLDFLEQDGQLALVLEDFGGISLKKLIPEGFTPERFLVVAIRLSRILGALHSNNIFHRDIKPSNILINPETETIKITDFGIAAEILQQHDGALSAEMLEGTLAYVSPEQTGRMNCPVDYRTDLYSLGITFYEMLTGRPPFQSSDAMEVIHAHIARTPEPPSMLNPTVCAPISDIVMKLLAKPAEERYQNSFGVAADLEYCLKALERTGRIDPFVLGRQDISRRFIIPQSLVGRKAELATLYDAFDRTCLGAVEFVLVTGEPGIGKSALVHDLYKPIARKSGYFIAGKYDQFHKTIPYSALIQAFSGLVRQLLTEDEEALKSWKARLLDALGPNGKVLTKAIPAVEMLIGPQPEAPEMGPEETQNRFHLVFKNFVRVFAQESHPLVLFLDDLQWADSASLDLIQLIAADRGLRHCLLIGAYRNTEAASHHLLMNHRDALAASGLPVQTLHLGALKPDDINALLASFLRRTPEESRLLARVIFAKTKGNPFFVNQFLKTLYDQRYLTLDPDRGWIWELDKINALQVTENVVLFMAEKLHELPADQRDIARICACIGNRFDLETLSAVTQRSLEDILSLMDALILEGILHLAGEVYRFSHDRVREAAYGLLSAEEREGIHYRIGRRDLERTSEEDLPKRIFYICDQLNQARRLMKTAGEQKQLAWLNLQAGVKAKESGAYAAAATYLATGMDLLDHEAWQTDYTLAYRLFSENMECQYLNQNADEAKRLFEIIITRAASTIDRARAHNTLILLHTLRAPRQAISIGLDALKIFNIHLNMDMGKGPVALELIKAMTRLRKIGVDHIIDLPLMKDQELVTISELLLNIGTPAYFINPNLFAFICLKAVNNCFRHGLMPDAPLAFVTMATILQSELGRYSLGYRLGKAALKLNEKLGRHKNEYLIRHAFAYLILHWNKHLKKELPVYANVHALAISAGDLMYAGQGLLAAADCRMMLDERLDDVLEDLQKHTEFFCTSNASVLEKEYRLYVDWIQAFKGQTGVNADLSGQETTLSQDVERYRQDGNMLGLCIALCYKMSLLFYFRRPQEALALAETLDRQIHVAMGAMLTANHYFMYSLILAACLKDPAHKRNKRYACLIRRNLRKLEGWARRCPDNFQAMHDLAAAEAAGIAGRFEDALRLYHNAIACARKNGFLSIEALACELLADFYLSQNCRIEACSFLRQAHDLYTSWGATAKAQALQEGHPDLLREEKKPWGTETLSGETTTSGATSQTLDFTTMMKVSTVISGEIQLDRLLQQTMHMSLANAGAQRGYLILESKGELFVQASEDVVSGEARVLQAVALNHCDGLSAAIVRYVYHSSEDLILGDAAQKGAFRNDPHVLKSACKSILCLPILNNGRLMAILYMENNLTADAFTPERIKILRMISAQAAISLQNANLYESITQEIAVRKKTQDALIESYKRVQEARVGTILGLAKLAEYRDEATGAHLERIREYARLLAQELAVKPAYAGYITPEYIEDIYNSSILHDIGKVGVPDAILLKPGKLSPDEFEIIKTHTTLGGDALRAVEEKLEGQSFLTLGKEIAYAHHEKWDGSGYPRGLKGEKIPLSARIVALADVYDALTSQRVYKEAFSHEKAKEIILKDRGTHFAHDVVEAFLAHEDDFRRIRESLIGQ